MKGNRDIEGIEGWEDGHSMPDVPTTDQSMLYFTHIAQFNSLTECV